MTPKPSERQVQRAIELPWPPSKLSPNAKKQGAWRQKRLASSGYRDDCLLVARGQCQGVTVGSYPIMVDICFHEPNRIRRDLDNLLAMTKQGIDAIAECIGVDDYHFEYTLRRGEPVKGGIVRVTI